MAKKASNRHLIYKGKTILWSTCLKMLANHLGYAAAQKKARDLAIEASEKWSIPYKSHKEVIWTAVGIILDGGARIPKRNIGRPSAFRVPLQPIGAPHPDYVKDDGFYASRAWREVRLLALDKSRCCQACGARPPDVRLHVDHVIPRYKAPHLSLNVENLQVLCEDCNYGKGAWSQADFRHFQSI